MLMLAFAVSVIPHISMRFIKSSVWRVVLRAIAGILLLALTFAAVFPYINSAPTGLYTQKLAPSGMPAGNSRQYILNTNSRRIHYPYCESVLKMKESNKQEFFGTVEQLQSLGYVPCKNCFS